MRKKAIAKKITAKWEYLGETDPAEYIHSNKTHRTVSEAFRDADYATAFWRSRSDLEEAVDFVEKALLGFIWVGVVAGTVGAVVYWLLFS
jgi:hypothetical protein